MYPSESGGPRAVSPPVEATLKVHMRDANGSPTNKNLPSGVAANDIPKDPNPPTAKGDPAIGTRVPDSGSILNTLTFALLPFETYRNFLILVIRSALKNPPPKPRPPVANGEPGSTLNVPFTDTENADTVFPPFTSSFVYTKLCWGQAGMEIRAQIIDRRSSITITR